MTGREVDNIVTIGKGDCPDCGNNVEITHIAGIPGWLYGRQFLQCPFELNNIGIVEWSPEPDNKFSPIGGVKGKCQGCGRTFYSEQTSDGDWTD